MTTPFKQNRSTVAGHVPTTTDIPVGGISINLADRILFTSNGTNTFILASPVIIQNTAPTSVVSGSLWWNNNDGALKIYYDDGSSLQWVDAYTGVVAPTLTTIKNQPLRLPSPQNNDSPTLLYTNSAITLTEIKTVVSGTTPSVTSTFYYGSNRSGAGNTVIQSTVITTNNSTGNTQTTFTNANIPASSYVWCTLSGITGTVTEYFLNLRFT